MKQETEYPIEHGRVVRALLLMIAVGGLFKAAYETIRIFFG